MGGLVDVAPIGILLLTIYIIIDCIRNKTTNLLRRVTLYSFVVYIIYVFQYTTGGFHYPPQQQFYGTIIIQPHPFQFVSEWIHAYQLGELNWFFWNSVRSVSYTHLDVYKRQALSVHTPARRGCATSNAAWRQSAARSPVKWSKTAARGSAFPGRACRNI